MPKHRSEARRRRRRRGADVRLRDVDAVREQAREADAADRSTSTRSTLDPLDHREQVYR